MEDSVLLTEVLLEVADKLSRRSIAIYRSADPANDIQHRIDGARADVLDEVAAALREVAYSKKN